MTIVQLLLEKMMLEKPSQEQRFKTDQFLSMSKQSEDLFLKTSLEIGVSLKTAKKAIENLKEGNLYLLALNGWIASGKDTLAPLVFKELETRNEKSKNLGLIAINDAAITAAVPEDEALEVTKVEHLYFSLPLKKEVDEILGIMRNYKKSFSKKETSPFLAKDLKVSAYIAEKVLDLLWNTKEEAHARSRTPEIRDMLQYWGTNVKREEDANYWVKKALKLAVEKIADGKSVYFTDVRFENEADTIKSLGFKMVQIVISREEQYKRLKKRDGIDPDPAVIFHLSETALLNWEGFDLKVKNEKEVGVAVKEVADFLQNPF